MIIRGKGRLIDGNLKEVEINNVAVDNPLAVKMTITNPNNVWIKIDTLSWKLKSNKNNEEIDVITKQERETDTKTKSMTEILIPPRNKKDLYIILDAYNKLDANERIGFWEIDFEEEVNGISYFKTNILNEEVSSFINPINLQTIKPNSIQFTVKKEPKEIPNYGFINRISGENINPLLDSTISILSIISIMIGIFFKIKK